MPLSVKKVVEELDHFIVENEKTARRFIKRITPKKPQPSLILKSIDKYADALEVNSYLDICEKGISIGVLSEAGVPGIADPGAEVVALAHKMQIEVFPFVGPSSILLALIASGKNGQNFTFNGYLPKERGERVKTLKNLERLSRSGITQIFMETPFRNNHLIEDVLIHCDNNMELCIASNITLSNQKIKTSTINDWKKSKPEYHKDFCIFVM